MGTGGNVLVACVKVERGRSALAMLAARGKAPRGVEGTPAARGKVTWAGQGDVLVGGVTCLQLVAK